MSEIQRHPQMKIEGCKVVHVIETISFEGAGVKGDSYRVITRYWDFDGKLLAFYDPQVNAVEFDAMIRAGKGEETK